MPLRPGRRWSSTGVRWRSPRSTILVPHGPTDSRKPSPQALALLARVGLLLRKLPPQVTGAKIPRSVGRFNRGAPKTPGCAWPSRSRVVSRARSSVDSADTGIPCTRMSRGTSVPVSTSTASARSLSEPRALHGGREALPPAPSNKRPLGGCSRVPSRD